MKLLFLLFGLALAFQPYDFRNVRRTTWSPANGRRVIGQRKVAGPTNYFLYPNETITLDAATPFDHIVASGNAKISPAYVRRLVLRFNPQDLAQVWHENPIDSAVLEVRVTGLVGGSSEVYFEKYIANVGAGSGWTLSKTTWACPEDANLRDGAPVCANNQGQQPGGASVSFGHSYRVRNSDVGNVIRVPITELVASEPSAILIRLADEDAGRISKADEFVQFNVSSARIVITQQQAKPGLSFSHTYPDCKRRFTSITAGGESISIHNHYCEARKRVFGSTPTVVDIKGVYFDADVSTVTGSFFPDHGFDEIVITQHCTGQSSCFSNGYNDIDFRIHIMMRLLFWDPNGFQLEPGTVFFVSQDQGSALVTSLLGWAARNGYMHYFASHYDYDGWTTQFYCPPETWYSGGFGCSRFFFGKAILELSPGFYPFALCSQHGYSNETNPAVSCRAKMHNQYEFWANYSSTDPARAWENSAAEADLRATYPFLNLPQFDPFGLQAFSWFGYENLIYVDSGSNAVLNDFAPGELTFHNIFTKAGQPQFLLKRQAQSQYPEQLYIPYEDFEAGPNSVFNPSGDPYGMKLFQINDFLGVFPQAERNTDRTYRYATDYSQWLLNNVSAADPEDFRFFYAVKPGISKQGCIEAEALVVNGRFYGSLWCACLWA
jgi:hypothetical protein